MGKEGTVPGMKKLLTVLATILLTVSLLAAVCTAAAGEEVRRVENPVAIVEMDTPVSSDAAENYIKRAFGLIGEAPRRRSAPLSGFSETVYNALAEMVLEVVSGERSSAVCDIPFTIESLGVTTTTFTAEALGVSSLLQDGSITNEAYSAYCNAVFSKAGMNLSQVILRLKSTLPYDMFWYGNMYSYSLPFYLNNDDSAFQLPEDGTLTIALYVSANYSVTRAEYSTDYDTSFSTRIRNAAAAANSIVSACAGQPAYDRLVYYRNAICNAVSYNYDALNAGTPYGDPWQAVNVFDGDPDTNVVCEGYSKAFKYLCDLSHFSGVTVSLVTGDMDGGTGAGPHMWNLVSVSGKNYLVDVTNCDEGTIGAPDKLFMAGYTDHYSEGSRWGYIYEGNYGSQISYLYDSEMSDLYSLEELTVEDHNYDPALLHTVFFNANGGSGEMPDQIMEDGVPTKLTPNAFTPPAGCHFAGWNTEADGSGEPCDDEAEITPPADLTLYAMWEEDDLPPARTWTVYFEINNGGGDMEDQTVTEGVPTKLNANTYTPPAGFRFAGWNTEADGSGDAYEDEAEVTLYADLTLFAIWENDSWIVTFVANNGTEETSEQAFPKNHLIAAALDPNPFDAPEYHHFKEWNTKADGLGGTSYADREKITPDADMTLYAIWEEDAHYMLSFDANGGSGTVDPVKVYSPFKVTLPANTLSLTGCYPNGWDDRPGTGYYSSPAHEDGSEITLTEDRTLYAHWGVNNPWFSVDVIDRIDWTEEPVLRHVSGGVVRLSAVFHYGNTTEEMVYADCQGGTNYTGMGDTAITLTAVPSENYEFVGWYAGEQEAGGQTQTPVDLLSEEPSWSFEATGNRTWTGCCAVFRFVPPAFSSAEFTLPDDLTRAEENAFEGIKAVSVYVPDSCEEIGAYAFKDCTSLLRIRLPQNCDIDGSAFDGCRTDPAELGWNEAEERMEDCNSLLVICAPAGGSTQEWAEEHHILFAAEE